MADSLFLFWELRSNPKERGISWLTLEKYGHQHTLLLALENVREQEKASRLNCADVGKILSRDVSTRFRKNCYVVRTVTTNLLLGLLRYVERYLRTDYPLFWTHHKKSIERHKYGVGRLVSFRHRKVSVSGLLHVTF